MVWWELYGLTGCVAASSAASTAAPNPGSSPSAAVLSMMSYQNRYQGVLAFRVHRSQCTEKAVPLEDRAVLLALPEELRQVIGCPY